MISSEKGNIQQVTYNLRNCYYYWRNY